MSSADSPIGGGVLRWPLRPAAVASLRQGSSPASQRPTPPSKAPAKRFVRSNLRRGFTTGVLEAELCPNVSAESDAAPGQAINNAWGSRDLSTEPKLKLGDLLGLVTRLLVDKEHQAATWLLDNLASSIMADLELTCAQSLFKFQLAKFLEVHSAEVSKQVLVSVQRYIDEESELLSKSGTRCRSAASSRRASDRHGMVGKSKFRCGRPARGTSSSAVRSSSSSKLESSDRGGPVPNEECADGTFVPDRIPLRYEDVEVSDLMHTTYGESSGAHGREGVQGSSATAPGKSSYGRDQGHEAFRKGSSSFDVGDFPDDRVDEFLSTCRAAFIHDGAEDLYGGIVFRSESSHLCCEGAGATSAQSQAASSRGEVEDWEFETVRKTNLSCYEGARQTGEVTQASCHQDSVDDSSWGVQTRRKQSLMLTTSTQNPSSQPSFIPSPRR